MSSDFLKIAKGITLERLSADPVDGQNGDIYYNIVLEKFRKFQSGVWEDLDTQGSPTALTKVEFASSDTFEVPAGIESLLILACGAGGGGGGAGSGNTGNNAGGGGSGGRGASPLFIQQDVIPGDTLTITIGAGGTGGTGSGSNGTAGGNGGTGGQTLITGDGVSLRFPGATPGLAGGAAGGAGGAAPAEQTSDDFAPLYLLSSGGGAGGGGNAVNGSAGGTSVYAGASKSGKGKPGSDGDLGGNGGGGGGASLAIGGHGARGGPTITGSGNSETVNSVTRVNNVVTINISTGAYASRNFNEGEIIRLISLDASISTPNTQIVTAVPTTTTLQFASVGPDMQANAKFVGQVAGMTTDVTITANTAGLAGNSINLTFDGVVTITARIATWNAANPGNQATLSIGNGAQVPNNGSAIVLSGAWDQSGNIQANRNYPTYSVQSGGRGVAGTKGSGGGGGGGGGGGFSSFIRGGHGGAGGNGYVIILY